MKKPYKGKAIYNPSGKAGEYSYWACNFYTGCSNDCSYCYCKRGVLSSTWSTEPILKSCFRNEDHALEVFEKELIRNQSELREHGLFFSFTTDPMLPETIELTMKAANICVENGVPVKILTKRTDWMNSIRLASLMVAGRNFKRLVAFGFTLTGHDELELDASPNQNRIDSIKTLYISGYKTFASIEPIIDFNNSKLMIENTIGFCNLYKIGLQSGKKYSTDDLKKFIDWVLNASVIGLKPKIYFKDSLLQLSGIDRKDLPSRCVTRNYNLFN